MNIALTFDLEKDANLSSTNGMNDGLEKILEILEKYSIKSTFFVTSNIAKAYRDLIKELSKNNEIGSHGHVHEKYDQIGESEKKGIEESKLLLEKITKKEVHGFRAPFLFTNLELYDTLIELGFKYDASGKPDSKLDSYKSLKIFKVSYFNVFIRSPFGAKLKTKFSDERKKDPVRVLYFHPWEAVEMKKIYIQNRAIKDLLFRPDRWINTGNKFLERFEELLNFLKERGFQFKLLKDLL